MLRDREVGDAPRRLLQRLVFGVAHDADDFEIATPLAAANGDAPSERILIGKKRRASDSLMMTTLVLSRRIFGTKIATADHARAQRREIAGRHRC